MFAVHDAGMEKPEQRPEGKLVAERIKSDSNLSIRKVAKEIGLSEARIRQIINGYTSAGRQQYIEVFAPTDTLASIALAVGIDADDMELAGRRDVSDAITRRISELEKPGGFIEMVDLEEIQEWATEPFTIMPPTVMLELFDDDQLVAEMDRRLAHYRYNLKEYQTKEWQRNKTRTTGGNQNEARPQP